jgi:hypothetical protein
VNFSPTMVRCRMDLMIFSVWPARSFSEVALITVANCW